MKPFTYAQKKWAMTACLLGALSFTLSMNQHENGLASIEFASSSDQVEAQIPTAKGAVPVKFIKSGDNEVLAVIPKLTEGKMCDICGQNYTLNISFDKNKDDLTALNVALLKEMEKSKKVVKASKEVDADEEEDKPTKEDLAKEKQIARNKRDKTSLIRSLSYCSEETATDQSECLVSNYLDKLEKGKIDPKIALEVFRSHVESKITQSLMAQPDAMSSNEEKMRFATNIKLIASTLDKLQTNLHPNYNNVRARVMDFEKTIVEAYTQNFKTTLSNMLVNPNDHVANAKAQFQLDNLNAIHKMFNTLNNPDLKLVDNTGNYLSSLKKAVDLGNISSTDALSLYKEYYLEAVSTIINGANRAYKTELVNVQCSYPSSMPCTKLQTVIDLSQIGGGPITNLPGTNPRIGNNSGRGFENAPQNNQQYNQPVQNNSQEVPGTAFQSRSSMNQGQQQQHAPNGTVTQPMPNGRSGQPGRPVPTYGGRGV